MECPRCGGELETYSMWGRESKACSQCNYVGIPVEHQSERDPPETWSDAISRFYQKHKETTDELDVDSVADDLSEIPGIDDQDAAEEGESDAEDEAEVDDAESDAEDEAEVDDAEDESLDDDEGSASDADPDGSDVEGSEATETDEESAADAEESDDDESEVVADGGPSDRPTRSGPGRHRKRRKRR